MHVHVKFDYGTGYLNCAEVQYETAYLKLKKIKK